MRKYFALVLFGSCLLIGCSGGSLGGAANSQPPSGPNGPNVSFSPNGLNFGTVILDTTSQSLPLTLTNSGTATLDIEGIAASANFGETNTCAPTLAPGANCTINVTFTPTASGTLGGTLSVTDNASNSPQTVSISGTGGPNGPNASFSSTSLAFDTVAVDTTSAALCVKLTNYGNATLDITSTAVSANFELANPCITPTLAPGANCTISVTFTPSEQGPLNGTLSITDNASNSPQTVSISGTGSFMGPSCSMHGRCSPDNPNFPPCCRGLVCQPASSGATCVPTCPPF